MVEKEEMTYNDSFYLPYFQTADDIRVKRV